jgi:prepilin-type N-terminal cleavage/methylation domain-containing protein
VVERLRQLHSDEGGFTLTELLAAMAIGLVLLMSAFFLIDHANSQTQEVLNRQEAIQRGRMAMERMTRALRSQVCLNDTTEPITYGGPWKVQFYSDLSDGSRNVQSRVIEYDSANQRLREQVYYGQGVYPDLTFPAAPDETNHLLDKVDPVKVGATTQPMFRYYAFRQGGAPGDLQQLPTPLSSSDASLVVMVKISYVTLPDRLRLQEREASTLHNDVYVRLADPSRPTEGPRCL